MRVVLDVKNMSGVVKPSKNNVMLFNGKEWYITSKTDLFKEYNEKIKLMEEMLEDNKKFKENISSVIAEMSEIIKTLLVK